MHDHCEVSLNKVEYIVEFSCPFWHLNHGESLCVHSERIGLIFEPIFLLTEDFWEWQETSMWQQHRVSSLFLDKGWIQSSHGQDERKQEASGVLLPPFPLLAVP